MVNFRDLVLVAFVADLAHGQAQMPKIQVNNNGWLVDDVGRVRMFHGINSVWKGYPWYDLNITNTTRLDNLQKWGFNAVRLGLMWSGVQPQKAVYNSSYVKIMEDIVDTLGDRGVYTILDMHQDVLSSKFRAYDGIPRWLVDEFPESPEAYPFPIPSSVITGNWALGYLTKAVSFAFQNWYDNVNGATDAWVDFWGKMAAAFGKHRSVLGYELINEPWAGDIYKDPLLLVEPGRAGSRNFMPMYEKALKAIREHDESTLLFYEPTTWAPFINSTVYGTGFSHVPGGSAIKQTGGARFLTEFGLCAPDGTNDTTTVECHVMMDLADQYLQSWTYWDSDFYNAEKAANLTTVKGFSRTYAQAVQGIPTYQKFSPFNGDYTFKFIANATISEPTEIYVAFLHYPNGYGVSVSPGIAWTTLPDSKIKVMASSIISGKEARVTIWRK